jgi:alanyl-tRNA synthetase
MSKSAPSTQNSNTIITSQQVRDAFIKFFEEKGHQHVSSSSLVPGNDPTLLFTNAGMVQFKDVFLGKEKRESKRAVTSQKCVRAGGKHNDLENVGYTARHHTFFEMLGNFSFGDYFKRDAIFFAWEFLTKVLQFPEEKLWVTVYKDDIEAEKIWFDEVGIDQTRFSRLGEKDNFWSMGDTGPCGPCSEIFYDHGEDVAGGPPGSADEDGDRYIEIWNLVFMQFDRAADGSMQPLPNPSIDTGMGLERVAAIMQNVHSNYQIDLFQHLIKAAAKAIGTDDLKNKSLQVVADHIRSCSFLVADGVLPSNEGRGYVLRRIIRRAVRHGNKLGAKTGFFSSLVKPLAKVMGDTYDELNSSQQRIEATLLREEQQFAKTLNLGMELLDKELQKIDGNKIPGNLLFKLYDTYGFPVDLTADIARERNLEIDQAGFNTEMEQQQKRSRASGKFESSQTVEINSTKASVFVGYDRLENTTTISEIFIQGEQVDRLAVGEEGVIILEETPFYAESGGQVGDKGRIFSEGSEFEVLDTTKVNNAIAHFGKVESGSFSVTQNVQAVVAPDKRIEVALNHSATHLLHAALREILGEHVIQKGSMVSAAHLRFDFANPEPVSNKQLKNIETLVNFHIRQNYSVVTELMSADKAQKSGAMALFGEKYGDQVRVLTMGDFSKELCGGTHVKRTGDIGLLRIISETGIASGVRRIEAITGSTALRHTQQEAEQLNQIAALVKVQPAQLIDRIGQLNIQLRQAQKSLEEMQAKMAIGSTSDPLEDAVEIGAIKLLCKTFVDLNPKALRETMDKLRDKMEQGVVVLATINNDKAQVIVGVSKSLTPQIHAGKLVNFIAEQIGGKGGGRPDMAQAGGSDVTHLPKALNSVTQWITENL